MGQLEQKIGELPFSLIGISRNLSNQLLFILAICLTLTLSSITLLKKLSKKILQKMNGDSQELILELKELQAIFSRI